MKRRPNLIFSAVVFLFACTSCWELAAAQASTPRFDLRPGTRVRYRFDSTWIMDGERGGLGQGQSPYHNEVRLRAVIEFEVLPESAGATARRFQATFESAIAVTQGDSNGPASSAMERGFHELEGQSFTFELGSNFEVTGSQSAHPELAREQTAQSIRDWLRFLFQLPGESSGKTAGGSWTHEEAMPGSPLAGVVSRETFTFLREGTCRSPGAPSGNPPESTPTSEKCAVIQTRSEIVQPKSKQSDPTPEEYRAKGLKTTGTWTGKGESMNYVSIQTGWLVSRTATREESLSFTVSSKDNAGNLTYSTHSTMNTQITQIPPSGPPK